MNGQVTSGTTASNIAPPVKSLLRFSAKLAAALAMIAGTASGAVDFERDIRPVLRERCVECHGPKKQKAVLRLDARAFAFKGSENGAVFVPGKSAERKSRNFPNKFYCFVYNFLECEMIVESFNGQNGSIKGNGADQALHVQVFISDPTSPASPSRSGTI